jgi:hypothetical protein
MRGFLHLWDRTARGIAGATFLGWMFLLPLAATAPAAGDDLDPREAKVKSAFLLNFARYVEWPEYAFASTNSPIVIAVLGEDLLQGNLDATVAGKTVETHPVQVKRARRVSDLGDCHIVFVCPSERDRWRTELVQLRSKPILSVSELDGFTSQGGIILLRKKQGMMRFEINREAAERAGLKISSKLLKLADNYR